MFGRKRIPVIPPTETNSTQKLLIFVCTSSTCRSPMAEQFGIRFLKQHNLTSDYTIISRSLTDKYETPGSPASAPGIEVLMEDYGLDMKEHRSCLLKNSDVDEAHAIIGVSQSTFQVHYI